MSDPQNPNEPTPEHAGDAAAQPVGEPAAPPVGDAPLAPPQAPPAYSAAPSYGGAPAYGAPPAYDPNAAPAYSAAPTYPGAPGAPAGYGPDAPVPGKTLGIVAFVLSFFAQPVSLILGIVALVQSKKAGVKNNWALAAIIISAVLLVLSIILVIVLVTVVFGAYNEACDQLGSGIWQLTDGTTITCG
ncbi:DUF4190 domain-containing protein [Microbacterium sp. zg.Y1084]|uniref:DUF4190 domain-containing protein n=1 Tax=Microbacterium sp. zg.Y1084 TaxID=2969667 RepID=UPI00214A9328|nr:DUF4190 domain-containing protein [Microbacterium sp. zg.Y1084]MCR2813421.1 DUF4190 domain-containing protein [Microbacterium sp. zg.Y1084]